MQFQKNGGIQSKSTPPIDLNCRVMFGALRILSIDHFSQICKRFEVYSFPNGKIAYLYLEAKMAAIFPSEEWLTGLETKLNADERYGEIAKGWEGDLFIIIEPAGNLEQQTVFYLDLWHGKCRGVEFNPQLSSHSPVFTLTANYDQIKDIMIGKLNPMTAMMTMKLKVKGNMGYMMRNVPTVLDFVRCAQEVTTDIL
jgi:putative sterol carrier protein